jgi:hypothetical protein
MRKAEFEVVLRTENTVLSWGLPFSPGQTFEQRDPGGKTAMSRTKARISIEAALADGQDAWLELLAPDRKPRLKPYGHAAATRQPRLPQMLNRELLSLRCDR